MNPNEMKHELVNRRAALVEQQARLKRIAAILMERGVVCFDKERHCYAISKHPRHFIRVDGKVRPAGRDMIAALKLMELQSLIKDQAVRLLELEDILK